MGWFGGQARPQDSRRDGNAKGLTDGLDLNGPSEVGHEDIGGRARVAAARAKLRGAVRLHHKHGWGEDAHANREIGHLGGAREASSRRNEAHATGQPRRTIAGGDQRSSQATKRLVYAQGRLANLLENVKPAREAAVEKLSEKVEQLRDRASDASPVAVALQHQFLSVVRVELAAVLAAIFDGGALEKPIVDSGIASADDKWILIALIAAGIWVTVNALGMAAGALAVHLDGAQRRKGVILLIGGVAGVLIAGLVFVGVLRHDWTLQTNASIAAATHGTVVAPTLMDGFFLSILQIAVVGGAAGLIAMCVMAKVAAIEIEDLKEAEAELAEAKAADKQAERDIETERRNVEQYDIAINQATIDSLEAQVDHDVIREAGVADREHEQALTKAAQALQDGHFLTIDKLHQNGGSWLAQHPDVTWRRKSRPASLHAATDGGASSNGTRAADPDDVERFVNDINNQ